MVEYIYFVKCPNCEDEHFSFFNEAKEFAMSCLSQKPIITQIEVNRNDFGECTDSCDLGTVWSWEDIMTDEEPAKCIFTKGDLEVYNPDSDLEFSNLDNSLDFVPDNFRKPVPADMSIDALVEEMEENEDDVECKFCHELFDKSECIHDRDYGWLCPGCQRAIREHGGSIIEESVDRTIKTNYYYEYDELGTTLSLEYLDLPVVYYSEEVHDGISMYEPHIVATEDEIELPYYMFEIPVKEVLKWLKNEVHEESVANLVCTDFSSFDYDTFESAIEKHKAALFNYFYDSALEQVQEKADAGDKKILDKIISVIEDNKINESVDATCTWCCFFDDKEVGTVKAATEEEALDKMQLEYPEYPYNLYDGCFRVEQVSNDNLTEVLDPSEMIELEYPSLTVTLFGAQRDVDDWDEIEHVDSYTFLVPKVDVATAIWENWITEADVADVEGGLDALEDDAAWERFLETHFDILFEKYNKQILDYFEDEAAEDFREKAQEEYSLGNWEDNSDHAYETVRDELLLRKDSNFKENVQKSFLEEFDDVETYKASLTDCPECGTVSYDMKEQYCCNCGFNL